MYLWDREDDNHNVIFVDDGEVESSNYGDYINERVEYLIFLGEHI